MQWLMQDAYEVLQIKSKSAAANVQPVHEASSSVPSELSCKLTCNSMHMLESSSFQSMKTLADLDCM